MRQSQFLVASSWKNGKIQPKSLGKVENIAYFCLGKVEMGKDFVTNNGGSHAEKKD